jgi:hypothetical protein
MRAKYETLDEYLDDLDAIKEKIAEETLGMSRKQVIEYFNQAVRKLEQKAGQKLRLPRRGRKASPAKR